MLGKNLKSAHSVEIQGNVYHILNGQDMMDGLQLEFLTRTCIKILRSLEDTLI